MRDVLTDAMLHPTHLESYGKKWGFDGSGHYAHHGMLLCAEQIRIQLQQTKILHKLFNQEETAAVPSDASPDIKKHLHERLRVKLENLPNCEDYNLVVIGHSLGAGVAAILSLLLRNEFRLQDNQPRLGLQFTEVDELKAESTVTKRFFCISYAPPGCIFSEALSKETESFMLSPVVGKDMVPHLSWLSLQKMRLRLLDALHRTKVNKFVIFSTLYRHVAATRLLYPRDKVPETVPRERVKKQLYKLARRTLFFDEPDDVTDNSLTEKPHPDSIDRKIMQCPGKIVHFARLHTKRLNCYKSKRIYAPFWVEKEDMIDMQISTRTVLDHFPNYYAFVLQQVYEDSCSPSKQSDQRTSCSISEKKTI